MCQTAGTRQVGPGSNKYFYAKIGFRCDLPSLGENVKQKYIRSYALFSTVKKSNLYIA